MKWSFYQLWNQSLEQVEKRPLKERNYLWATDLGGSKIDVYLKMLATQYSNPPNPRSLRKFEAGNIWEWIVGIVLTRSGILIKQDAQIQLDGGEKKPANWCRFQYPNLLAVTGKTDYLAGGKPDYDKASFEVNSFGLPKFITDATLNIVKHFADKYPDGLQDLVLEIKSCSSYMFDVYERNNQASKNHRLQAFHYLKAKNMPEAHVVYISKDDARMLEIPVFNPSETEDEYKSEITAMTEFYNNREQPPKEENILFEKDFARFTTNYRVAYSNYLTYLYGYKNQLEFDLENKPVVERYNRVMERVVTGKTMTPANIEVIDEIKRKFENYDEIVSVIQKKADLKINNSDQL